MPTKTAENAGGQVPSPNGEGQGSDNQPIKPLEPIDNTQRETPKVGTTEAPGG